MLCKASTRRQSGKSKIGRKALTNILCVIIDGCTTINKCNKVFTIKTKNNARSNLCYDAGVTRTWIHYILHEFIFCKPVIPMGSIFRSKLLLTFFICILIHDAF